MQHITQKSSLPPALKEKTKPTEKSRCVHCDQQIYLRAVDLSSQLLYALKKIRDINDTQMRAATSEDMAKCGRVVYCNYTQLKYWSLIETEASGWRVSELGRAFLAGELELESRLYVFSDEVREHEDLSIQLITVADMKIYTPPTNRDKVREEMVGLANA